MQERLQKVLAARGVASRRKCEELISSGRIKVNGEIITELGFKVQPEEDRIEVDGKVVKGSELVYLLLYKPAGFITSAKDPQGRKVVLDLLQGVKQRVYPVGRLDYGTSGLLLLTNDGELANYITHPKFEIDKVYLAAVAGIPTEQDVEKLRRGIQLDDGMTAPALVEIVCVSKEKDEAQLKLTIHEGRNRQVRRMCEAIGHPVRKLKRIKLGFLTLGSLKPGQFRHLTPEEVKKLQNLFK